MEEIWVVFKKGRERNRYSKEIEWEVSNLGNIKKDGKPYTPYLRGGRNTGKGMKGEYLAISTSSSDSYVHRIVAKAFIPNPENKKTVDHIDGNKMNNVVDNLTWATNSENIRHNMELKGYNPGTHTYEKDLEIV